MARKKPKSEVNIDGFLDPKDHYIYTDLSIMDLSKKWKGVKGCSERNLSKRCTIEGWAEERRKHREAYNDELSNSIVQKKVSQRMKSMENWQEYGQEVQGIAMKMLRKSEIEIEDMDSVKAARAGIAMLKNGVDIEMKGLGIHDDMRNIKAMKEFASVVVSIIRKYLGDQLELINSIAFDIDTALSEQQQKVDTKLGKITEDFDKGMIQ